MKFTIQTFEEVAEDIGLDFFQRYKKCVDAAHEDWLLYSQFNLSMDFFIPIDPTTKANHIHNRICGRLSDEFKDEPDIKIEIIQQLIVIRIRDKYIFRTKKLHPKGRVSYTPTEQQKAFMQQDKLKGMFERPLLLTGGYMMNRTNSDFLGVFFACHSSSGVEWFVDGNNYIYQQLSLPLDYDTLSEEVAANKPSKISFKERPKDDTGKTGTKDNK